jgi:hypothetical protein
MSIIAAFDACTRSGSIEEPQGVALPIVPFRTFIRDRSILPCLVQPMHRSSGHDPIVCLKASFSCFS